MSAFFTANSPVRKRSGRHEYRNGRIRLATPLLALLVWQNLFNAFSPYLTLALNVAVACVLCCRSLGRIRVESPLIVTLAIFVLFWLAFVAAIRGAAEPHVVLKYLRTTTAIVLLSLIFGNARVRPHAVTQTLNLVFGCHILLIFAQVTWPAITGVSASIFGFTRESSILENYVMRKLGASSSYDTASLFSVAGLLFFSLQFLKERTFTYLCMTATAFLAALMSSRAGILMALVVVFAFAVRMVWAASPFWKILSLSAVAVGVVEMHLLLKPLVLHSLGLATAGSDDAIALIALSDYGTTGTWEALTQDHLQPLKRPPWELLLGYAADPNTLQRFTDIGYVKLIYHVGIVGTAVILAMHVAMLNSARSIAARAPRRSDRRLLATFLLLFLLIALAFNYKSLEIYSRGVGDFMFLLSFYLCGSELSTPGLRIRSARLPGGRL